MKQKVSPVVGVIAVVALLAVIGSIGFVVFGKYAANGPAKPPPEMQAKLDQQKMAMQHSMSMSNFNTGSRSPNGQNMEQRRIMEQHMRQMNGH
jgi:hypothetical protein